MNKNRLIIPKNYKSAFGLRETEAAVKYIKDYFQDHLAEALNLQRISAPIAVLKKTGLNDYLNDIEKPVSFKLKDTHETGEIVQSLAKWKRNALADYGFKSGEGLYTDMNAIRPDEVLDNLHSIYVDQWDWERVITGKERNLAFLKFIVGEIYRVIRNTEIAVCKKYKHHLRPILPEKIHFIHTEVLQEKYPELSPKNREHIICKKLGAVFLIGIGAALADGKPHDGRAADYDDWTTETGKGQKGLNGDILVWYPPFNSAFELSSMGIRVDKDALIKQLKILNDPGRVKLPYHQRLIKGELPMTIGGGIGQSRLCMFFLRKAHIGEVQASIWPEKMIRECHKAGISLL